jgi:hypothetical protein
VLAARRRQRRAPEVARRRIALARLLGQRARHDPVERARDARGRRLRERLVQMREQRRRHGAARIGRLAGQHRVQDASQRVDVGARVGPRAAQLLGRAVVDAA